ncbi:MAG TPA: DUF6541 family protein [Chloroflexota bacterium]|nr:DUF6541 family protein [Chloroflexota bacterium]
MVIGLLFAGLAIACGVAIQRILRLPVTLAPLSGLAAVAVLSSWCAVLQLPPFVATALIVLLAVVGLGMAVRETSRGIQVVKTCRLPALLLGIGSLLPAVFLGTILAGVATPVSAHDGAFHVETIDGLRHGVFTQTWYPVGFHASVAAVLNLLPWVDTARGTLEAAEGLAILAPLAVFALALALGADTLMAATAAIVLGLTWTYPYDYHLWGGWPQGMGVLLLMGLLATAAQWIARPTVGWAILGSLFASAIVLSHGTEVYSSVLGLLVIGLIRWRSIKPGPLVRHVPLAVGLAVLLIGPYLLTLIGWAKAGAATSVASSVAEYAAANPAEMGRRDMLQFALGITGAASLLDFPVRIALIALGLSLRQLRLAMALWLLPVLLLLLVDFFDLAPIQTVFILTYPWLYDDRPRQLAVVFASVLAGGGLVTAFSALGGLRTRLAMRPATWRRLALGCVLLLAFFAEGSGVSVYKRIAQTVDDQNMFNADDEAAMGWLRQHALPGEVVANDSFRDAGIWAPYKAGVAVLLPRSGTPDTEERRAFVEHIGDLSSVPAALQEACALHVAYVYRGARPMDWDQPLLADRATLEHAADLREVFTSGEAAIFQVNAPCG